MPKQYVWTSTGWEAVGVANADNIPDGSVTPSKLVNTAAYTVGSLTLGSSGPQYLKGTGSPESVITAPVGSEYIDTAATNGAIKWIKATGAGNTGWQVVYGDTGWRNIASWDASGVFNAGGLYTSFGTNITHNGAGYFRMRRRNNSIDYQLVGLQTTAITSGHVMFSTTSLPVGWRAENYWSVPLPVIGTAYCHLSFAAALDYPVMYSQGAVAPYRWIYTVGVTSAWPTSLPGVAA